MAVLRLPLIVVVAAIGLFVPRDASQPTAFLVVWVVYACWSVALLWWLFSRSAPGWTSWLSTFVDLVALVLLAGFSSGASSYLGPVFYLYPIAVAFQYRPRLTATVGFLIAGAYVVSWLPNLGRDGGPAVPLVVWLYGALLLWLASASTALTLFLVRRSRYVLELLEVQRELTGEAIQTASRERSRVSEELHDGPLQDLVVLHRLLEEMGEDVDDVRLEHSDALLTEVAAALRGTVSELHPQVLDSRGLSESLEDLAHRQHRRTTVHTDLDEVGPMSSSSLVHGVLRELLNNVDRHAHAENVWVELRRTPAEVTLTVEDDGVGLEPGALHKGVAAGHIGLASLRLRISEIGGNVLVGPRPIRGTRVVATVPVEPVTTSLAAMSHPDRPEGLPSVVG